MWLRLLSVLVLFLVSYLRHTYYFDFTNNASNFFVSIRELGRPQTIVVLHTVLVFFILYGVVNWMLAYAFTKKWIKPWIVIYALLFGLSGVFFFLYHWFDGSVFFKLATIVKNFLLSPVYPMVMLVVYYMKKRQLA